MTSHDDVTARPHLRHERLDHTLVADRAGVLILEHVDDFVGVVFLEDIADVDEELSEGAARHGAGVVLIVRLESFHHVFISGLSRCRLDLLMEATERLEVDAFAFQVGVDDHFLDVSGERVESARSHHVDDLEVFHFAVSLFVVHVESLLDLFQLFGIDVRHFVGFVVMG